MRLKTIIHSAAILGLCAGAASAADPTRAGRFTERDENKDGVLTLAEFLGKETAPKPEAAVQDDGYIKANPGTGVGGFTPAFTVKDRNRDGMLTRAEYGDARTFDRVDSNNDGRISRDEFLNPPAADSVEWRFDEADRNDDGVVTRREWRGTTANFRDLDRNRDGRVSRDEFQQ